ncbi:uncharacterized protein LOC131856810 [Cryptomeria japonica]|uniref:uncharacterized protein LOC131856810 n=1 Tax=Cryptomeria japonica TaxID=3369 RepID=UPI0027D9D8B4|nr:uncharacterized protein LOC131856810 [Cryptomeria japonica]
MRQNVSWEPPEPGYYKLKFDGVAKGNSGEAGYGCIIRDSRGEMVVGISGYLGIASNIVAEFTALEREFKVTRVYREANTSADYLANKGVVSKCEIEEHISIGQSAQLSKIVRDDMSCSLQNTRKGIG